MITAGIDIGSRTAKAVVLDDGAVRARCIRATGWDPERSAREIFEQALVEADIRENDLGRIVATGYGRVMLPFADETVTEITCHARGAHNADPSIRTIVDIGGQDSKIIRLDEYGLVEDFFMNDRCAAGTGKFLEYLAHTLDITVAEFGEKALESNAPASISSMCTVFAESEVLSLLAESVPPEDIVAGIHLSIARRIAGMINQIGHRETVALTGGVAHNPGMRRQLGQVLRCPVAVPDSPEYMGALGAALS